MQTKNKFIRSAFQVIISNFFILLSGILVGFILPKIMGVEEYAYYKIFILYTTYVVLLYFGFADGMLVKYGGQTEDEINLTEIRFISKFFIKMELLASLAMLILCSVFLSGEYRILFAFLSIYTFFSNLLVYLRNLAQAMMKFEIVSQIGIIQSFLTSISVIACYILIRLHIFKQLPANFYIPLMLLTFIILTITLITLLKNNISIPEGNNLIENPKKLLKSIFKIGIPVAISYQINTFILNLDNQIISIFLISKLSVFIHLHIV